jgi:prolipoprotein diacylglyceryl transferase
VSALVSLAPLFLPSPSRNVWHLGPLPLRAYALCIIVGIVVGMVIATRRWRARGGTSDGLESVVVLAVPFGIVGARLYHVITDYELYFGPGRHPVDALKIWQGGLGIWGAVALGALGGWLVARRRGIRFPALLDACAPGLAVAQGIGRLGNWFNSELFGRPTTLPWGLEIAPAFRPVGYEQYATFHPTFLYELIWDVLVAVAVILLDRRFRLGHGKVFTLYVLFYTAGRFWIEALRIDTVNRIDGFRLNNYTSVIVFVAAALVLAWLVRNRPGRETEVERAAVPAGDAPEAAAVRAEGDDVEGGAGAEQDHETARVAAEPADASTTEPGRPRVDP